MGLSHRPPGRPRRASRHLAAPDLDGFCLPDRLGLTVTAQQVLDDHAVLACRVVEPDDWCHECGCQGEFHDTVVRRLAHVPFGWRPTLLHVRVRRYPVGRELLIDDPSRFDGVRVLGVDEHRWRHTRRGDKYVTVIIDLIPVRDGTGPARLLDMVEGRSKQVFSAWLQAQPAAFRNAIDVVAMDGFHRVQDRQHRAAARRDRGHGPVPRDRPGR